MQLKRGGKQKERVLGEYPFSSYFQKWIQKVTEIQLYILISIKRPHFLHRVAEASGGLKHRRG